MFTMSNSFRERGKGFPSRLCFYPVHGGAVHVGGLDPPAVPVLLGPAPVPGVPVGPIPPAAGPVVIPGPDGVGVGTGMGIGAAGGELTIVVIFVPLRRPFVAP